ncbi:MAG: hypothetical protein M3Z46_06135 [Actinomycetota bacterium]|nr:hypothetical protein [Actinomycetota bacterium]
MSRPEHAADPTRSVRGWPRSIATRLFDRLIARVAAIAQVEGAAQRVEIDRLRDELERLRSGLEAELALVRAELAGATGTTG